MCQTLLALKEMINIHQICLTLLKEVFAYLKILKVLQEANQSQPKLLCVYSLGSNKHVNFAMHAFFFFSYFNPPPPKKTLLLVGSLFCYNIAKLHHVFATDLTISRKSIKKQLKCASPKPCALNH